MPLLNTVSSLLPSNPLPQGNADTITAALAPFPNTSVKNAVYAAASTGNIPPYTEPSCQGAGIGSSDYVGSIGANAARNLFPSIPIIGSVLGGIVGAFGAHHAAAVKQEQAILCAEVPGIIQFLRSVDSAISTGSDPAVASQALESAYSTFVSRTQPIFKSCNAACDYRKYVRAAIEYRKQNYALMIARNASGAQGVIGGAVSSLGNAVSSLFSPAPAALTTANAGFLPAGFTLTQSQAKLGIVLVAGFMFFAGILYIVRAKREGS